MTPRDGLVDFLGNASYNSHDYCVGYAWTEIDVPGRELRARSAATTA